MAMKEVWAGKGDRTRYLTINSVVAFLPQTTCVDCMTECSIPIRNSKKGNVRDWHPTSVGSIAFWESYREMKRKLGRDDSQKLERYMQALREVEREIERMERWTGNDVSPGCTSSAREPAFGRAGTRTGRRVRKGRG